MFRAFVSAGVCLIAVVALACVGGTSRQAAGAALNEDWLRSDEKRIAQVRDALGRAELTVELLREIAGSSDVREDRAIGFGARRVRLSLYGGYTTIWVVILAEEPDEAGRSRVAALAFEQRGSPETWAAVAPRLREAWKGFPATGALGEHDGWLAYERRDADRIAELRARTEAALGTVPATEVPSELAPAFELLTSPYEQLVIGRNCSYTGAPPPGAVEIRAIVAAGRFDLVRLVLRGPNPEGRVWAAHALLERGALDDADRRAIETLRALPLEIECCDGCEFEHASFDAALKHAAK